MLVLLVNGWYWFPLFESTRIEMNGWSDFWLMVDIFAALVVESSKPWSFYYCSAFRINRIQVQYCSCLGNGELINSGDEPITFARFLGSVSKERNSASTKGLVSRYLICSPFTLYYISPFLFRWKLVLQTNKNRLSTSTSCSFTFYRAYGWCCGNADPDVLVGQDRC